MDRQGMLRRLADESFDLLVIGGGITGAAVAREAAQRGLRTALVEQLDFAWGTSSRSTKLIHGGLRYLRNGEFRLVREAVVERQRLLHMAPHLVRPLTFVFPVYAGDPDPLWKLKIGLMLYDRFSGRDTAIRHRIVRGEAILEWEPLLNRDGLVGGGLYMDCATDDSRLVIEVLTSAVEHGVSAANYVAATEFKRDGQGRIVAVTVEDRLNGTRFDVRCQRVLSAAGPWADCVRWLDEPGAAPLLRRTKGVHIAVRRERLALRHAVTMRGTDKRIMFAIPSGAFTYLGTTDTDYEGPAEQVCVEQQDVDYILEAARKNFPQSGLGYGDIVSAWAGLRPLINASGGGPSSVSRDYALFENRSGLVTVAGGKLTAFRSMASHIVDRLFPRTRGSNPLHRSAAPLPGATENPLSGADIGRLAAELGEPAEEVERVVRRYGRRFPTLLQDYAQREPGSDPQLAWRRMQLRYAVRAEMAMRLEDVFARRTSLMLFSEDNGLRYLEELAREMGALCGWSQAKIEEETAHYRQRVREMFAWREQSSPSTSS